MVNARYSAVELGSPICSRLKQIYFPGQKWADCYMQVSDLYTKLKKNAKKFYVGKTDVEILKDLLKYTNDDLVELLTLENKENTKDGVQTESTGTQ